MSLAEVWCRYIERENKAAWQVVLENFNPALEGGLIHGGYMTKEESMKVHSDVVVSADSALYDAGFAAGAASIVMPVEGGQYSQEQYDAAKIEAEKVGYDKAVAADTTPISQEQFDALHAQLDQAVADGKMNAEIVAKVKAAFTVEVVG